MEIVVYVVPVCHQRISMVLFSVDMRSEFVEEQRFFLGKGSRGSQFQEIDSMGHIIDRMVALILGSERNDCRLLVVSDW